MFNFPAARPFLRAGGAGASLFAPAPASRRSGFVQRYGMSLTAATTTPPSSTMRQVNSAFSSAVAAFRSALVAALSVTASRTASACASAYFGSMPAASRRRIEASVSKVMARILSGAAGAVKGLSRRRHKGWGTRGGAGGPLASSLPPRRGRRPAEAVLWAGPAVLAFAGAGAGRGEERA